MRRQPGPATGASGHERHPEDRDRAIAHLLPRMRNIYISDTGKDDQDGLTSKTPIHSWARYLKIKSGSDNLVLIGDPETILKRLYAEIEKRMRKPEADSRG